MGFLLSSHYDLSTFPRTCGILLVLFKSSHQSTVNEFDRLLFQLSGIDLEN